MASDAKDIQLREMKDTISQLKTIICEQTELIKSLRLITDEKSSHEKALQEQVDYLTKKLFGFSSERRSDDIPGQQSPGTEGRRTPGTDTIFYVAVPQRRRRSSAIILYGYSPTRSGSHAKEFLEGYHGYLKFLLDHRPTKEMTDDQLAKLAPWSQKLQFIKNRM